MCMVMYEPYVHGNVFSCNMGLIQANLSMLNFRLGREVNPFWSGI